MIDEAFYKHIKDTVTYTGSFVHGGAGAGTPPYIIMKKLAPASERPLTFCQKQGDAGTAIFQFSGYLGGASGAGNEAETMKYLEAFKVQVAKIKGLINNGSYRIWSNITEGVTVLSEDKTSPQVWGAYFETTIKWEVILT